MMKIFVCKNEIKLKRPFKAKIIKYSAIFINIIYLNNLATIHKFFFPAALLASLYTKNLEILLNFLSMPMRLLTRDKWPRI